MKRTMRTIRPLLLAGATAAGLAGPPSALAQSTNAPATVVPQDRADADVVRDLQGVPDSIKSLLLSFDQVRDKYLLQQEVLLVQFKNATTAQEREQIRDKLQANRQQFLDELKMFRQELQDDIKALQGKISHTEFLRIIDAAAAASDPNATHRHRGH